MSSLISLQQLIIEGFCETPAEEKEFLNDAHIAAHRLLAMIDDLVVVARIDYGRETLELQSIDLESLFAELKTEIALPVGNANFQLHLIPPPEKTLVNGDRQRLLWVLRNLIDGCLQTTKAMAGEILLQTQSIAPHIKLELQLPCPLEIWQVFTIEGDHYHLQKSKIQPAMSLSPALCWQLCQTILQKMNGSLTLIPQAGDKTTVTITLPLAIGNLP